MDGSEEVCLDISRPARARHRGGMPLRAPLMVLAISLAVGCAGASPKKAPVVAAVTQTGDVHDFDYFAGAWTTHQRRLTARGVGSNDWEEFPGTLCMTPYLGGMATVDELWFPTKGWAGLTLRTFDVAKRQWKVYWVSGNTGTLDTPVAGGFDGDRGEFYGNDEDGGRPVKVRYSWHKLDHDRAHWEQAFTYDGATWEVNWTPTSGAPIRARPATAAGLEGADARRRRTR